MKGIQIMKRITETAKRIKTKYCVGNDNKGYTLVEIIAAVVILAIVVIPLLNCFLSVAKLNAKAKKEQEATVAAQNLMETIKASSVEELLGSSEACTDEAGVVLRNEDGSPKMKVEVDKSNEASGKYIIYYNQCDINGNTYRAVAKMDAGAYRKEEEAEPDQYNDMSLADVTAMSEQLDAFFIQDFGSDTEAAEYFGGNLVYESMNRDIVVDIKNVSGKTSVVVSVTYEYGGNFYSTAENVCVYSGTKLENVYVFFQPMYTSNGTVVKEQIHIKNEANLPLNVYLVKQAYSSTTAVQERNYRVSVDVSEPNRTEFFKDGAYYVLTDIQTNLDKAQNQYSVTYGGFSGMNVGGTSYAADKLVGIATDTSLVKENKVDRIYSVEISVYKAEDDTYAEALVTLTGTKEE